MSKATTFDVLADNYDAAFTDSLIGQAQRHISYKWLQPVLSQKTGMQLLEINCGTGTDASPAMIDKAKQKALITTAQVQPVFQTSAFDALQSTFQGRQFDGIVSNFAGLNCVSPDAMGVVAKQFHQLLRPGGFLAVVLFGKYCLWETMYYLLKAQPRQAFRRWSNQEVLVPLSATTKQPVYYYSIKKFARLMQPLQLIEKRPVGLCIPPSWMEAYMQQHRHFFQLLVKGEEKTGGASFTAGLADHTFLLFKKEVK